MRVFKFRFKGINYSLTEGAPLGSKHYFFIVSERVSYSRMLSWDHDLHYLVSNPVEFIKEFGPVL